MSNSILSDIAKKLKLIEENNTLQCSSKNLVDIGKYYNMFFSQGPVNITFIDKDNGPSLFYKNIVSLAKLAGCSNGNPVIDPKRINKVIEESEFSETFFLTGVSVLFSGDYDDLREVFKEYIELHWNK